MQSNWIGKSDGAEINFKISNKEKYITIFTTRPDTIFGATFLALSVDHEIAIEVSKGSADLQKFIKECEKLNPDKVKGVLIHI